MAEYGEWNRKGATLSHKTAEKEYGVDLEFIIKGIRAGKLEYREGEIYGNPYLRVLRSQLEKYIEEERGKEHLMDKKDKTELHAIKREISSLEKKLNELNSRKAAIEDKMQSSDRPKRRVPKK